MYWRSGRLLAVYYTSLRRAPWVTVSCATDERERSHQEAGMADHHLTEQFRQLCEQAAKETDSKKLLELTQAINRIFDERDKANQDLARRALGS